MRDALEHSTRDFLNMLLGLGDQGFLKVEYYERMNAWIKPFDSGLYNDNHLMIRLNALMALFNFGYYEVHKVLFTFLGLLGIIWIVQDVIDGDKNNTWALALAILFPSSLLWLGGGLKETVLVFGIGAVLKGLSLKRKQKSIAIILLFLGMLVMVNLKLYYLAFLLPALFIRWLMEKRSLRLVYGLMIWAGLVIVGIVGLQLLGIDIAEYIARKQHEFINHASFLQSGSQFEMKPLDEGWLPLLMYIPEALINALFRPFPWEVSSLPEGLMLIENLVIIACLIASIYMVVSKRLQFNANMLWVRLLVFPLLILIGTVTPVFGAIMRYRAPAILFLLVIMSPYIRQLFESNKHVSSED